jgi:hypothetical protein
MELAVIGNGIVHDELAINDSKTAQGINPRGTLVKAGVEFTHFRKSTSSTTSIRE